jgi:hypothetical protein
MWEAEHLATMQAVAEASLVVSSRSRSEDVVAIVSSYVRYCAALRGPDSAVARLPSDEEFCAKLSVHATPVALFSYYYLSAELAFLRDDQARAAALLAEADRFRSAAFSTPAMVDLSLLQVLVAARQHDTAGPLARVLLRRRMAHHVGKLAHWAELCPQNFAARHRIAVAEATAVAHPGAADAAYEAAIASALEHGNRKWEAVAFELWSRHQRRHGKTAEALAHLRDAIEAYRRWGADRHAAELEAR